MIKKRAKEHSFTKLEIVMMGIFIFNLKNGEDTG